MNNKSYIKFEIIEGESQEIIEEKEYILTNDNISYKLKIIKDSEYIEFKINNINNNILLFKYCCKYKILKIIDILGLDIESYDKIMEIINDAYTNNKIQINQRSKECVKLTIQLINKALKDNKSILTLNKTELNDNEKFELIINEINAYKKNNEELMKNKFDNIEKEFINLKSSMNKNIQENNEFVNSLKKKIEDNENILNKNIITIESLKNEIQSLNKSLSDIEEKTKKLIENNKTKIIKEEETTKENEKPIKQEASKNVEESIKPIIIDNSKNKEEIKNKKLIDDVVKKEKDDFIILDNKNNEKTNIMFKKEENITPGKNDEDEIVKEENKDIIQKINEINNININNKQKDEKKIKEVNNNKIQKKDEKIIKDEDYKIEKFFDWEDNNSLFFSVMLVGDTQVGKSWIYDKFFDIPFTPSPSIFLESDEICIKINDDVLSLNIQDIPGNDIFFKLNLTSSIIKQDLIIFVYSIDNKKSFETISTKIKEVKENCTEKVHYLLIGNKLDLNDQRKVSEKEGDELAKKEKLDLFMEVSAKTGENIDKLFFEGAKILYKNSK